MHKLLPAEHNWPLHSAASSRAIEREALATLPPHTLMERAGLSAARLCLALSSSRLSIWLLCGPGNNGGDGLVTARLLHSHGMDVSVSLIGHESGRPLPPDAQAALAAAQQAGVNISEGLHPPQSTSLAVDALLGLGISRAPTGEITAAINCLNACASPVLALDLPSGLLADTGNLAGSVAVHAQHTLSLLTLKPGLFTAQGRAHCGQIWFDSLGVEHEAAPDALLLGAEALQTIARSRSASHAQHKGSQGDALVLGGAPGLRGAARLAARAALASGAGRVYVCLLESEASSAAEADAMRPELMQFAQQRLHDAPSWQDKVLVCGCGGGDAISECLPMVLRHAKRLVLDADALNAVANNPSLRPLLTDRAAQGLATVLTPHPLEAARLLGCSTADVQADRLKAARNLSTQFNCQVILKGSGSIIADPESNRLAINSSGNAALATAGSGDVLAGWLGGLWAQHPNTPPALLASAACYWHGRAADEQEAGPLRAADLVERMHALHRLTLAPEWGSRTPSTA
ncbi:NAD(P)H-hydrate dehydratase [Paucibacter sp. Y2R2-4]|uniref:NAD(P)H-hydrate dehydratase n=1 Tax=Paucibacter sp. Y2R2-4 TaxID=2893553 RepID=UPI0021E3A6D0|nr:NAD(P)H-hydrate dehydratase [Paucibacter sp. Y2R2-4]MCV2349062.1 NAD(P)H-hydrate dehydratase [Paucibacter sp. Y2R2-4]